MWHRRAISLLLVSVLGVPSLAPRAGAAGRVRERATGPSPRCCMEMAGDRNGNVVLFGGESAAYEQLGDTWTWDGSSWTERHPAASPSPRCCYAMGYDGARGEVVLFGGYDGEYRNDTWTWDGSTWTEQHPPDPPTGQYGAAMAYDAARQVLVLFGATGPDLWADTWTWDGTTWTRHQIGTSLTSRPYAAMGGDGASGGAVLFGGINPTSCGDTGCDDFRATFTWDGTNWRNRSPDPSPTRRSSAGIVYDGARQQILLFGGAEDFLGGMSLHDTWAWDGRQWTNLHPSTRPSIRCCMAMAFHRASGLVVLFGGTDEGLAWFGDTWTWDGTTWTRQG